MANLGRTAALDASLRSIRAACPEFELRCVYLDSALNAAQCAASELEERIHLAVASVGRLGEVTVWDRRVAGLG